jgi:hypothetical protein
MRGNTWIIGVASLIILPGCANVDQVMGDPGLSTSTVSAKAHFIKLQNGNPVTATDRSNAANDVTVTVTSSDGVPTSASASVAGTLGGGSSVPGLTNQAVVAGTAGNALPSFGNPNDDFLGPASINVPGAQNFVLARYQHTEGNVRYIGYGASGTVTPSMPTVGGANYSGKAGGTVVGSQTGAESMTGDVTMTAAFAPGGGAMQGQINNIVVGTTPVPLRVVLAQGAISGNTFGGAVGVQTSAGAAIPGLNVDQSNYQGTFFGASGVEAAGSFQISATGVPCVGTNCVGTQSVQAVGGFGARQ